jgi:hypothetical protein
MDAWLPPNRMGATSSALHKIQGDACCVNHSNIATLVVAGYGIISQQYLDLIKNRRAKLRQLITELRQAVVGSDDWIVRKKICDDYVMENKLPGSSRMFNFEPN